MATDRFNTACPSCEATIGVRSASVGKKIECPKCKFRFVVTDPSGEVEAEPAPAPAAKGGKADPKGKGKKQKAAAKGGGNSKVLVGALVGVLALAGLAVGAYMIFGGETKSTEQANNAASRGGAPRPSPSLTGGDPETPAGGPSGNPMPMTDAPGPTGEQPGGEKPAEAKPAEVKPAPKPAARVTGADITNLLPNEAKSVLYVRMEELAKTPLKNLVFDGPNKKMFKSSLRFDSDDMLEFVHCYVGDEFHPFVVIRTKADLQEKIVSVPEMDTVLPTNSPINNKWHFREIRTNPFITAVANSITLPELFDLRPNSPSPAAVDTRKYAVSLYDGRTMLVAESNTLQRFLSELTDDGFPKFLTDYKKLVVEDPPATTEGGESPTGQPGGGSGQPMGEGGRGQGGRARPGGTQGAPNEGPGGPGSGGQIPPGGIQILPPGGAAPGGAGPGGAPAAKPKATKPITSNPSFRTVDRRLKKALNQMQDEAIDPTAVLFASQVNQRAVNQYDLKKLLPGTEDVALNILKQAKVSGLAVTKLSNTKGGMFGYLEYGSDSDAKTAVEDHILPMLGVAQLLYQTKFKEQLSVVNANVESGSSGGFGGQPGMQGMPGGRPGGLLPGGPAGLGGPGGPSGGPAGLGGPGPGGSGKGNGNDAQAPRGGGGGSDDAQGKGGLGGRTGGPGPGEEGSPGPGGPGGPGFPGGPGGFPGGPGSESGFPMTPSGSRIEVYQADTVVTLSGEFVWKANEYNSVIQALLNRSAAQIRGKMALFSGDSTIFAFSDREAEGRPGVMKLLAQKSGGQIPQGAVARDPEASRKGLPYPPEQRFSFFVPLLPFLENKGGLYSGIAMDKPWYATENLRSAETWVPELLVPDYPPSAWRATSELVPNGGPVGGTNYVGVAGLSLDAARFDPKNPDQAKKVGLLGYEFGSKPEDVKDGLSNTMYLIQTPPGLQRPWIAGGGATLMGVDDTPGADPARPFLSKRADGSRTTTVLMGDGSVRTIREGIDPAVFRGMATRAGGETIPDLEKTAPKQKPGGTNELVGGK